MKNINKYFNSNFKNIKLLLDTSSHKMTAQLLLRFFYKMKSISNIINRSKNADIYSVQSLIRIQIEHLLVIYYIWSKFCEDKNDQTAQKYYDEYLILEFIKRSEYSFKQHITSSNRIIYLIDQIFINLKDAGIINQKNLEKFYRVGSEFTITKINEYIVKEKSEDSFGLIKKERILSYLEHYNYLSSFIHAGPTADMLAFDFLNDKVIEASLEAKIWSKNILIILKIMILYFLSFENKRVENKLDILVNELLSKNTSISD